MPLPSESTLRQIHAAESRGVLYVTGGGSEAIAQLLRVPGASRTLLDARVPYSYQALQQCVGGKLDSACSERTARALAMAALEQAHRLDPSEPNALFGVGATASLASDRPKRGTHRVHVSLQTRSRSMAWNLILAKDQRTRAEEETVAASLILHAVTVASGITTGVTSDGAWQSGHADDELSHREKIAPEAWRAILWGDGNPTAIQPAQDPQLAITELAMPAVIYPGSFDPPHAGHQQLMQIAQQKLGQTPTLELSLTNVDKPRLDYLAIEDRLQTIAKEFTSPQVWLTQAPTFVEKAERFPEATFVVGADTITRIADVRYYAGELAQRDQALAKLEELGARFLVFGREINGKFCTLDDVTLPPQLKSRCQGVSAEEFRLDISSTQLRR